MIRRNGQRFLVALDGSDHSRAIIDYIERTIPPRDQEFVLFNVYQKVPDYYRDLSGKGAGLKPSSIVIRSKEVVQGVALDIVAEIHKGYNWVIAGKRAVWIVAS